MNVCGHSFAPKELKKWGPDNIARTPRLQIRADIVRQTSSSAVAASMMLLELILHRRIEIDKIHIVHHVHIVDVLVSVINRIVIGWVIAPAAVPDIARRVVGTMASDRGACGQQRCRTECG